MTRESTSTGLGIGHSEVMDPVIAARACVEQALAGRTPGAGDLVIVFSSVELDPWLLFEAVQQAAGDAQVVGCTSLATFTSAGQVPMGAVVAYLPAGELTLGVAGEDAIGADIYGAARRVADRARDRAGAEAEHAVLLMLSDGLAGDQREVVRGSYAVTGATVPLVGGAAGENQQMLGTYQYAERKVMTNGLVAVWINSPHPLGVGVEHGWHPIGEPMIVTSAEGNVIQELDGQPAAEMYLARRGSDPLERDLAGHDASFAAATLDHPLGLANASGRFDARHILDRTPDGGLTTFGHVSEHSVVQVLAGDRPALIDAAGRASREAVGQLDTAPRGALVFSCAARVTPLGPELNAEAMAISAALGGAPMAGCYTYGEFARVTGSTGFHNATVVVLAL